MHRRHFLQLSAAALAASHPALRAHATDPAPWRTFELTTTVELPPTAGPARIWLPAPSPSVTPSQRSLSGNVQCPGGTVSWTHTEAASILCARFPATRSTGAKGPVLPTVTLTTRVATRDWNVIPPPSSAAQPGSQTAPEPAAPPATPQSLAPFLAPTRYIPTDGIVRRYAQTITAGLSSDLDKTRAIYDWIVNNTYRNPSVRGCGSGDIRPMLASGDLGGKCADINALFVGLLRASGIPARDVYGIRVAPSRLAAHSLGISGPTVTHAQHCRAEVYLQGLGWTPMDPADVRKVILEEFPGGLLPTDLRVEQARHRLFGSWESNWIAFNHAQELTLPGASGPPIHFLMYPQAETAEGRLDCLNAEVFRYEITAREL